MCKLFPGFCFLIDFPGKIFPILSKLSGLLSPTQLQIVFSEIQRIQEPGDWIFIILLGWTTLPIVRNSYQILGRKSPDGSLKKSFQSTFIYHIVNHLSQAGKIAALVYGIDCISIALRVLGFKDVTQYSPMVAKAIYCVWMFNRINEIKKFFIFKLFGVGSAKDTSDLRKRASHARAIIVDRLFGIICLAGCFFALVDILEIKSSVTLKSIFTVGGAGTVVISLALKDIATEIVSGMALQASDKVYEDEKVIFANGIKGTVEKIGLFETTIRDSSELLTAIPNKNLAHQSITNISRNKFSQVKQTVNFDYEDLDKLPVLINQIKHEIKENCPAVVTDGSKPFRVYFNNYDEHFLQVTVDVRLCVTPDSNTYFQTREMILLAIGRAVKKMDMKFAVLDD